VKALSFRVADRDTYGVLRDGRAHEAEPAFRARFPDLRAVIAAGALDKLADALVADGTEEASLSWLPPIPNPDKTICVGVNYRPHAAEMGRTPPEHPLLFVRFPGSQVGHRQPLVRPSASAAYDYEGELAVVIGRPAWQVSRARAFDVIAGYCAFMDGTVRDWQRHTTQYTAGKNFRHSGAVGPWLCTRDEIADPGRLVLETRVNGEVRQQGRLADLIFDIPALVAYVSAFTELLPGDVIATGTPGGVGAGREPPAWLVPGDTVEVDLGPVGTLRCPVVGD